MNKIHFFAIGDELLNGKTCDKNAFWFSQLAAQNQLQVSKIHIIGDGQDEFDQAMKQALNEADIIVMTGGLGPTRDDHTKFYLADYLNLKLEENSHALKMVKEHYARVQREYDPTKYHYSLIPNGFKAFSNPTGMAPGLFYRHKNKSIFALPGVPSEFKSMCQNFVLPTLLKERDGRSFSKNLIFKTAKIPESVLIEKLGDLWISLETFGDVSSLPHILNVDLGVRITAESEKELYQKENEVTKLIQTSQLAPHIWHIGPEGLEEVIINLAKEKGLTIATAESCTGGLIAHRLTKVPGCSEVFLGSIVSYANNAKIDLLDIDPQLLNEYGAVSKQVAQAMAQGGRKKLKADICVSTTGIAGPGGGSKEKPVGMVAIGISTQSKLCSEILQHKGDRETLQLRFSQAAMFDLLDVLKAS